MQKLEILPLIQENQFLFQNSSDLVPRVSFPFCPDNSKITLISGPLHAGKTSFLRQLGSELEGVKIYIDFEDSRIKEAGSDNLKVIEEIAAEICREEAEKNEAKNVYYFLDEVQNIPGWEKWVNALHRQEAGIFVTSSNLVPQDQRISSGFEGKIKLLKLLPFSFKEYLLLKGTRIPRPGFLTPSRCDEILCMFLQYFENGGFPAVIETGDIRLVQTYFEEILRKIVASEYGTQDIRVLKKLAIFLISNMASEYSFDTLKKVAGIEDEKTLHSYIDSLENSFLIFKVPKLNYLPEIEGEGDVPCKVYAGDTGFFKAVYPSYPNSLGLRFENLVFLELLRQEKQIFYFQGLKECDFLLKDKGCEKVSAAIQVSVCLGSPASREREISGLVEAMEKYGLSEGLILTMDDEEILEIEGKDGKKKVMVKPVWKWMLE